MKKVEKYIKLTPLILLAIVMASTALYNDQSWWAKAYYYIFQAYSAIMLLYMLFYAVWHGHPTYLKIIYIGLIDINMVNCVTWYLDIQNWLPYTVIVVLIILTLIVYFLMRKKHVTTKHVVT